MAWALIDGPRLGFWLKAWGFPVQEMYISTAVPGNSGNE